MRYEIRLFDKTVLIFDLRKNPLGELIYEVVDFDDANNGLLPIGYEATPRSVRKFLESRVIPKNREFVDQILSHFGLSHNDTIGIINICKGLSLNDSYWVVEEGFKGKFADYNLFDNNFTRTLALIAYTGYGSNTKRGFTSSPEFTTNGMLKKCWRRENGVYLYKGGTSGFANSGNEPYSEYYASQIAQVMGLDHVNYNLSKWKGELCSVCPLFTSKEVSYVPIFRFLDTSSLYEVSNYLKSLGGDYYDSFADMLIFDALICNTDRHFGNFGLLIDSKTNEPLKFAPIFDNGLSLFNYAIGDELKDLDAYSKTRMPAYNGLSYDDIIANFLGDSQKQKLRKLINFTFKRHSKYNLPKERLESIESFLQRRIQYILSR